MAVDPAVRPQRPLEVHLLASLQPGQRRDPHGFGTDVGEQLIPVDQHHGEAHAIHRDAVANLQRGCQRALHAHPKPVAGRFTSATVPIASMMPVNIRLHPGVDAHRLDPKRHQRSRGDGDPVEEFHAAVAQPCRRDNHVHPVNQAGAPRGGVDSARLLPGAGTKCPTEEATRRSSPKLAVRRRPRLAPAASSALPPINVGRRRASVL